ncbi:MAG: alpha/beta hydrolase [Actinomycetota bacterium]|nr:alpha/beta hydrolase [Actinomycetota bacterium]
MPHVATRWGLGGLFASATLLLTVLFAAPVTEAGAKPRSPLPIIFVHGQSGSAQQFETNALRLTSNGFPRNRIFAVEYDTLVTSTNDHAIAALEALVARVKSKTGAPKVNLLGHSRGTMVSQSFLESPENAANVNSYVNYDGLPATELPGGVKTLAVWAESLADPPVHREITGAENRYFPTRSHTEVVNSPESFRATYRFLFGKAPKTSQVIPEAPNKVTVAGRAMNFPTNTGIEGGTLNVFRIDPKTGQRISRSVYRKKLDASGSFGPFKVNGKARYEFSVVRPGTTTLHNYPEPFERDNHQYRVLIAPLLASFLDSNPNHTNVSVTRMKEFRGDQTGAGANDRLVLDGTNVINADTAKRVRRTLAVFNVDRNSDGVTDTSASLSPFNSLSFLTGVDVFLPASADHSGTIKVVERMRDSKGHTKVTNIPNWPSSEHTTSVYFKDYPALTYKAPKKSRCAKKAKTKKQKKRCAAKGVKRR